MGWVIFTHSIIIIFCILRENIWFKMYWTTHTAEVAVRLFIASLSTHIICICTREFRENENQLHYLLWGKHFTIGKATYCEVGEYGHYYTSCIPERTTLFFLIQGCFISRWISTNFYLNIQLQKLNTTIFKLFLFWTSNRVYIMYSAIPK